jgi:hypothetical protein
MDGLFPQFGSPTLKQRVDVEANQGGTPLLLQNEFVFRVSLIVDDVGRVARSLNEPRDVHNISVEVRQPRRLHTDIHARQTRDWAGFISNWS